MKRKLHLAATLLTAFSTQLGFSQISGDHAFMIGDYVEIGINGEGYEGAPLDDAIPTHYRGFAEKLGFIANPAEDGWVEYNGDFYMPGTPENGFGITYTKSSGDTVSFGNNAAWLYEIPGAITDYIESDDSVSVIWVGLTPDSLQMTVRYDLQKDQHYYSTTISLLNIGSESFTDIYYYRNLDPDVNQDISWGFSTDNAIESQSGMADDSVRVVASQDEAWLAEMIFHAYGADWRGYVGGFYNRDGQKLWNGVDVFTLEGFEGYGDYSAGIVYNVASLPPGRSGSESFGFATAFKRGIVFETEPGDTESIQENEIAFDIYPNPTENDFLNITINDFYTYEILDLKGSVVLTGFGNGNGTIDLSTLDKGVYLLNLTQNASTVAERVVLK